MIPFVLSLIGACAQEILHWVDLKQELGGAVKITRSKDYWIITILGIILFTAATPFIIEGVVEVGKEKPWHYIVCAFGFPSIIRKLAKVLLSSNRQGAGVQQLRTSSFKLKNYFKIF